METVHTGGAASCWRRAALLFAVFVLLLELAGSPPRGDAASPSPIQRAQAWPVLLNGFVVEGHVDVRQAEALFERIADERPTYAACDEGDCTSEGVARWRAAIRVFRERIARGESATSPAILRDVSEFVNRWPYEADGEEHRWLSPLEYFAGNGDCEDNAVAKYLTLRELGVPKEQLFVVVSYLENEVAVHANLAVRDESTVWFLENQLRPEGLLTDDEASEYLTPLYVLHEEAAFGVLPLIGAPCRFPPEVTEPFGVSCDPELQILTRACDSDTLCPGDRSRTACIDLESRGSRCLRLQWQGYCGVGEPTLGRVRSSDTIAVACDPGASR